MIVLVCACMRARVCMRECVHAGAHAVRPGVQATQRACMRACVHANTPALLLPRSNQPLTQEPQKIRVFDRKVGGAGEGGRAPRLHQLSSSLPKPTCPAPCSALANDCAAFSYTCRKQLLPPPGAAPAPPACTLMHVSSGCAHTHSPPPLAPYPRRMHLQSFYTVHGEDALFVARRFCNTTAVVKYLGPAADKGGLASVSLNRCGAFCSHALAGVWWIARVLGGVVYATLWCGCRPGTSS